MKLWSIAQRSEIYDRALISLRLYFSAKTSLMFIVFEVALSSAWVTEDFGGKRLNEKRLMKISGYYFRDPKANYPRLSWWHIQSTLWGNISVSNDQTNPMIQWPFVPPINPSLLFCCHFLLLFCGSFLIWSGDIALKSILYIAYYETYISCISQICC